MLRGFWGLLCMLATLGGCASISEHSGVKAVMPKAVAGDHVFSNPIIQGFAPDPSIVRVGEDFYLINSTFEYFPGIPIYHSRDLVNWTLIGNALTDPAHADLATIPSGGGIHASTIRHHGGTYYIITTNVRDGQPVNFILTARNPAGPWAGPIIIEGAPGIDPSLLFDDDGKVWYVGNHHPDDAISPGQTEIWLQELDGKTFQLSGARHFLWRGCCQGDYAEGPHIYKRNGVYYLLVAEGGTSYNHAVSIAVAKEITGPYKNNPRNPVLTHRNLSYRHPITGVGHADLVELADGRWYAVALGWREIEGEALLGRETFLIPVVWETESWWWKDDKITTPVFSPSTGRVELNYRVPFPDTVQKRTTAFLDDFEATSLAPDWNFRRSGTSSIIDLSSEPGTLVLTLGQARIADRAQYSFVGIRQRDFQFEATAVMRFDPEHLEEEAGMILMQNERSSLRFVRRAGMMQVIRNIYEQDEVVAEVPAPAGKLTMRIRGDDLRYHFDFASAQTGWTAVARDVDVRSLSVTQLRGFNYTGVYVGLYGSSNGRASGGVARFDRFRYRPTAKDPDDWYYRQQQRPAALTGKVTTGADR